MRLALGVGHVCLCLALVAAASPPKLPAPLKAEPAYQSKAPQYFLLLLGRDAPVPVWLVLDGDILYVDRNSNGNLTEEGESRKPIRQQGEELTFALTKDEVTGYTTDPFEVTVSYSPQHKKWRLHPFVVRTFAPEGQKPRYPVIGPGGWFSDRPEMAGSNHVHSSLTMRLRTELKFVPGQAAQINISTGTLQPDGTLKTYCCILPADRHPVGEIIFPPAGPDQEPAKIEVRFQRQGCICHAHFGSVEVPVNVGKGKATVTLSFPNWDYGEVAPAMFEVPVEDE